MPHSQEYECSGYGRNECSERTQMNIAEQRRSSGGWIGLGQLLRTRVHSEFVFEPSS